MKNKKIALIITGLGMGGAERQVCDLCDYFSGLGHSVMLISLTGKSINRPASPAIDLVELGMCKTPLGLIKAYWRARKILKAFAPDVVHSHMVHANLFARLLRLSIRLPRLICTAHNTNEGNWARMLAYRLSDSMCDLTTNVSQEAVDAFIAKGAAKKGRIITMYNGIDTERFVFSECSRIEKRVELGVATDTLLLLAVGRLTAAKDYPNLLQAIASLPSQYDSAHLVIIGVGEEEAALIALVAQLGLTSRVHFLGLRRDVSEWMSAADLYVMSSAWEGMPLVLLEAMATARVVVATDCGGIKEVIGGCGFLVPSQDTTALNAGLQEALALTPTQVATLGGSARHRIITHYSLAATAQRWLSYYQDGE